MLLPDTPPKYGPQNGASFFIPEISVVLYTKLVCKIAELIYRNDYIVYGCDRLGVDGAAERGTRRCS